MKGEAISANCFKHGNDPDTCPQCAELRERYPDMISKPSKESLSLWMSLGKGTIDDDCRLIDAYAARAVEAEREAIMQLLEARRRRHGTGCDCRPWIVLGEMLDQIRARGSDEAE